jgi:hypothetical protein
MTDRSPFPDIVAVLRNVLVDLVGDDCERIGTATPSTLQTSMPFIRVQRFGGADDGFTDAPLVAIDAFAADRDTAWALAEAIRQRLLTGPHTVAGGTIDNGTTATAPNEVPWSDDQTIWRFTASYRVTARR